MLLLSQRLNRRNERDQITAGRFVGSFRLIHGSWNPGLLRFGRHIAYKNHLSHKNHKYHLHHEDHLNHIIII